VGKKVAFFNTRSREMSLVPEEGRVRRITAVAANKKYLILSEVLESTTQVFAK
jgi:hypothetical protein